MTSTRLQGGEDGTLQPAAPAGHGATPSFLAVVTCVYHSAVMTQQGMQEILGWCHGRFTCSVVTWCRLPALIGQRPDRLQAAGMGFACEINAL